MKLRQLGNSSLTVSELSLGCMSLPSDPQLAKPIIDLAINAGINYFDTADLYNQGENEALIGQLLKPHRSNIYIATKVGNRFSKQEEGWTWDPSRAHILKSVKTSLQRLQTDYIDLYQLHGGTIDDNLDEVIDTFEQLKKEGYIREYGISSIRPNVFVPFSQSNAVSNMMQFNMLDRCAEEYFDTLVENNMSVVTRGTLAKGLLTNDWAAKCKPYMNYTEQELVPLLQEMSSSHDLHALAIAFNLQFKAIASTVIGASHVAQLQETLDAYSRMPKNFPQEVHSLLKVDRYRAHR